MSYSLVANGVIVFGDVRAADALEHDVGVVGGVAPGADARASEAVVGDGQPVRAVDADLHAVMRDRGDVARDDDVGADTGSVTDRKAAGADVDDAARVVPVGVGDAVVLALDDVVLYVDVGVVERAVRAYRPGAGVVAVPTERVDEVAPDVEVLDIRGGRLVFEVDGEQGRVVDPVVIDRDVGAVGHGDTHHAHAADDIVVYVDVVPLADLGVGAQVEPVAPLVLLDVVGDLDVVLATDRVHLEAAGRRRAHRVLVERPVVGRVGADDAEADDLDVVVRTGAVADSPGGAAEVGVGPFVAERRARRTLADGARSERGIHAVDVDVGFIADVNDRLTGRQAVCVARVEQHDAGPLGGAARDRRDKAVECGGVIAARGCWRVVVGAQGERGWAGRRSLIKFHKLTSTGSRICLFSNP